MISGILENFLPGARGLLACPFINLETANLAEQRTQQDYFQAPQHNSEVYMDSRSTTRRILSIPRLALLALAPTLLLNSAVLAQPQLIVTEVMYNTLDTDSVWEWVEVQNIGDQPLDFSTDNYYFDDSDGGARTSPNITEGVIPAGGVAVIVDQFDHFDFDGVNQTLNSRFHDAWGTGINIIPANFFPGFNNTVSSGDGIADIVGLWKSADYDNRNFSQAEASIDYTDLIVPSAGGPSIRWNGTGDANSIANWSISSVGDASSSYLSAESFSTPAVGERLNDDDRGNPGSVVISGSVSSTDDVVITEIMYDTLSSVSGDEAPFEWFEIYNNTGNPLDTTGWVVDDAFSSRLSAANVAAETIPAGEVAIMYNSELVTEAQMIDAWGNLNFVAVDEWGNLFNGTSGETIGIWPDLTTYQSEANDAGGDNDDPTVTPALTLGQITYFNGANDWEESDGQSSVYLDDLSNDETDPFNWFLGFDGDGVSTLAGSMLTEAGQEVVDHVGGDTGSPGLLPGPSATLPGDFNGDNVVDAADYALWRDNLNGNDESLINDAGVSDGAIDQDDYLVWRDNFGASQSGVASASAAPEPASAALLIALGAGFVAFPRRR